MLEKQIDRRSFMVKAAGAGLGVLLSLTARAQAVKTWEELTPTQREAFIDAGFTKERYDQAHGLINESQTFNSTLPYSGPTWDGVPVEHFGDVTTIGEYLKCLRDIEGREPKKDPFETTQQFEFRSSNWWEYKDSLERRVYTARFRISAPYDSNPNNLLRIVYYDGEKLYVAAKEQCFGYIQGNYERKMMLMTKPEVISHFEIDADPHIAKKVLGGSYLDVELCARFSSDNMYMRGCRLSRDKQVLVQWIKWDEGSINADSFATNKVELPELNIASRTNEDLGGIWLKPEKSDIDGIYQYNISIDGKSHGVFDSEHPLDLNYFPAGMHKLTVQAEYKPVVKKGGMFSDRTFADRWENYASFSFEFEVKTGRVVYLDTKPIHTQLGCYHYGHPAKWNDRAYIDRYGE